MLSEEELDVEAGDDDDDTGDDDVVDTGELDELDDIDEFDVLDDGNELAVVLTPNWFNLLLCSVTILYSVFFFLSAHKT